MSNPTPMPTITPPLMPIDLNLGYLATPVIEVVGSSYAYVWSVKMVGDINKDGYSDAMFLVSGASYIVYGNATITSVIDTNNLGTIDLSGSYQGFSVSISNGGFINAISGAGDVNRDGYDDIIMGISGCNETPNNDICYFNSVNAASMGISFVVFGAKINVDIVIDASSSATSQYFSIIGNSDSCSGFSVSAAGDVNGDGFADIIIGAPTALTKDMGAAYIIYGNATYSNNIQLPPTSAQGFSVNGNVQNGYMGAVVSSAGDMNNDGYDDVIIAGLAGLSNSQTQSIAYVIYGNTSLSSLALPLLSTSGFSIYGLSSMPSVGAIGDFNKDEYDDIIVGDNGYAFVIYGSEVLVDISVLNGLNAEQSFIGFELYGANAGYGFGCAVSGAGDVNGDGLNDIVLGITGESIGPGYAYVVFGQSAFITTNIDPDVMDSSQGLKITGSNNPSINIGSAVSSAGDMNGDGYYDVLIGSYWGSGYIILGGYSTTLAPTSIPTSFPSTHPSEQPSTKPTIQPSVQPSSRPSDQPTASPTSPSAEPTNQPSTQPTGYPSSYPSVWPSTQPTAQPSSQPTNQPSSQPASKPTLMPSPEPTPIPTQQVIINNYDNIQSLTTANIAIITSVSFIALGALVLLAKSVCYKALENKDQVTSMKYRLCDYLYGKSYAIYKEGTYAVDINRNEHVINVERLESVNIEMRDSRNADDSDLNQPFETRNPITSDGKTQIGVRLTVFAVHNIKYDNSVLNNLLKLPEMLIESSHLESIKSVDNLLIHDGDLCPSQCYAPLVQNAASYQSTDIQMLTLFGIRQAIETLPMIKYLAINTLPASVTNTTLFEFLDDKLTLITTHLITGHLGAMFLAPANVANGFILSTIGSINYGARLVASNYLKEQQQETLLQDKPMEPLEVTKYCASTMLAGSVASIEIK